MHLLNRVHVLGTVKNPYGLMLASVWEVLCNFSLVSVILQLSPGTAEAT